MIKTILFAFFTLVTVAASSPSWAGNCDYDWQTASDGSRCGGRSADSRPGGYDPPGGHGY